MFSAPSSFSAPAWLSAGDGLNVEIAEAGDNVITSSEIGGWLAAGGA